MSEQPDTPPVTEVTAADLEADLAASSARPAFSDPAQFTDEGPGDGPAAQPAVDQPG